MTRDLTVRPVLEVIEGDGERKLQGGAYLYLVGESNQVGVTYATEGATTLPDVRYIRFTAEVFNPPSPSPIPLNGTIYPKDQLGEEDPPGWYQCEYATEGGGDWRVATVWWNGNFMAWCKGSSKVGSYSFKLFQPLSPPRPLRIVYGPTSEDLERLNWLVHRPKFTPESRMHAFGDWEESGPAALREGETAVEIPEDIMEALWSHPDRKKKEPVVSETHRKTAAKIWAGGLSESDIARLLSERFPNA